MSAAARHAVNAIDQARIAYRVFEAETPSSAAPLVLVHGTALSQAIWRGAGWTRALSVDRTVITLDLRGHGRSDRPHAESAYTMPLFAADVLAVLDACEVPRAHIAGYSLGGRVAFHLTQSAPDRMASLISVAGAPKNVQGAFDRVFFPGVIDALGTGDIEVFLARWQQHTGRPVAAVTADAFRANDARALAAYMRAGDVDGGVSLHDLAHFTQPALLLVGSRDDERMHAAELAAAHLPDARLVVIDDATHSSVIWQPAALDAVLGFLTDIDPPLAQ